MTFYRFNAAGWFNGEAEAEVPGASVPHPPPAFEGEAPQAGSHWPRWIRHAWALEPYAPAEVPKAVTQAQARIALSRNQIQEEDVDAVIAAMPSGQAKTEARIWWKHAQVFKRDHPVVIALAPQLGLSEAQIDALFILAATIES